MAGWVEGIFTAPSEALPVVRRERVVARPGVGLEGDRYTHGTGFWSGDLKVSRDLTLVEAEVAEDLSARLGVPLPASSLRRNVVTRGVRLNDLVGRRFRIGDVLAEGTSLCEPCAHLERVVGRPILRSLVHRGGLRANVLTVGELVTGAAIEPVQPNVGVGVLVKRDRRYLLGLRQKSRGHGTWSTPGGVVPPAEGVLACALRELREETGLLGTSPRVVAQAARTLDDGQQWHSVFVAVDVPRDHEPELREPDRCREWGWFEPLRLPEPLFTPVAAVLR